jgi:hypothetical protein
MVETQGRMYRKERRRVSEVFTLVKIGYLYMYRYTYSLCFLGDAYQKSNKDGTRTHLG